MSIPDAVGPAFVTTENESTSAEFSMDEFPVQEDIIISKASEGTVSVLHRRSTAASGAAIAASVVSVARPGAVAQAPDGTMYICAEHRVWLYRPGSEGLRALAGTGDVGFRNGPGDQALFNFGGCGACGIALLSDSSVLVPDVDNHCIRRVSPDGTTTIWAGSGQQGRENGPVSEAQFRYPTAVTACHDGGFVVADFGNHVIRRISADGVVSTLAGDGTKGWCDGPANMAKFFFPTAVSSCLNGDIAVTDANNHQIRLVSLNGTVRSVAGSRTRGTVDGRGSEAKFQFPGSIAVDAAGLAAVGELSGLIRIVDLASGDVSTVVGEGIRASASEMQPVCVSIDLTGGLILADLLEGVVTRVENTGFKPGTSATFLDRRWLPTRQCYVTCSRWTSDAVLTLLMIRTRTELQRIEIKTENVLVRLPTLPLEVWYIVLMMLPQHLIGRPPSG